MWPSSQSILVTGGAGFIGSHLVAKLLEAGNSVTVFDNLTTGRIDLIQPYIGNRNFHFISGDMCDAVTLFDAMKDCTMIYHLAANAEARKSECGSAFDFSNNLVATHNLISALSRARNCKDVIFSSTVMVYGEPKIMPTPEDYGPLKPISFYGATKLGCEGLLSAYSHMHDANVVILRIVNVVGKGRSRGVVVDFIRKLKRSPHTLEILGDGTQRRSFIFIEDCLSAFEVVTHNSNEPVEIYNVGSQDQISIARIAEIVVEEMKLDDVRFGFRLGPDGRGWKGDVKETFLDTTRIRKLGWRPKFNSEEAVRSAVRQLLDSES